MYWMPGRGKLFREASRRCSGMQLCPYTEQINHTEQKLLWDNRRAVFLFGLPLFMISASEQQEISD